MNNKKSKVDSNADKITRKEALKKAGKYGAFTATAMLTILSPKESQAGSESPQNIPVWDIKKNK